MIYGAMLAGGVGSRMKSATIPKQFLEVDGQPIILYTLRNMLKVERFDYIYIATHRDYISYMEKMIQEYIDTPGKVRIIEGGKERMDSIHNVTDAIVADCGLREEDVIVIHDAVRPLVTEKILNDSIDAAREYGACVCGLPAVDTMLFSEDGKVVTNIPERSKLYNGQAPDSFRLKRFLDMQDNLTEEQKKVITGTSQICTMNGQPIYIIEGDALNFKLTTDGDLLIFKSMIGKGEEEV
jgi:2-C-methyl-D-erythritol 4-phosphate cytidylyltransferase